MVEHIVRDGEKTILLRCIWSSHAQKWGTYIDLKTRPSSKTWIINVPHFLGKYQHFYICIVQTNVYSLTQCSHLLTALSVIWQLASCPKCNINMWLLSCLQDDGGLWNWRRSPGSNPSSQGLGGISVIHLFPKVHIEMHLSVEHVEDFFGYS